MASKVETKDPEFDADAYLLSGITTNRNENDEVFQNREFVLSFNPEDAGNIDMRIDDSEPLFNLEKILWAIDEAESLEEVKKYFPDSSSTSTEEGDA